MKSLVVSLISLLFFQFGSNSFTSLVGHFKSKPDKLCVKPTDDNPRPIRVSVKETNNDPVVSATVQLFDNSNNLLQSNTTDNSGVYTFSPVYPGIYKVRASKSGYTTCDKFVTVQTADVDTFLVIDPI